jgi:hypothetical protein
MARREGATPGHCDTEMRDPLGPFGAATTLPLRATTGREPGWLRAGNYVAYYVNTG